MGGKKQYKNNVGHGGQT